MGRFASSGRTVGDEVAWQGQRGTGETRPRSVARQLALWQPLGLQATSQITTSRIGSPQTRELRGGARAVVRRSDRALMRKLLKEEKKNVRSNAALSGGIPPDLHADTQRRPAGDALKVLSAPGPSHECAPPRATACAANETTRSHSRIRTPPEGRATSQPIDGIPCATRADAIDRSRTRRQQQGMRFYAHCPARTERHVAKSLTLSQNDEERQLHEYRTRGARKARDTPRQATRAPCGPKP